MASKPPVDKKRSTGSTKRFREELELLNHLFRARESLDAASAAFNNVIRIITERNVVEESAALSVPPPNSPSPLLLEAHPSKIPTRHEMPAMNDEAFVRHLRKMWGLAKTDSDREKVRDLLRKGRDNDMISATAFVALEDEFR